MTGPGKTPAPESSEGFGYSTRQIWIEVLGILVGLGLAAWGVIWFAGKAAETLTDWVPLEVDRTLGESAWTTMSAQSQVCKNPAALAYVESLVTHLRPHFEGDFAFEFRVVDDRAVNAFALPGGFITVNAGLVESAISGEEIAAVLGHEMAHVTRRHGIRRILRQLGGVAVLGLLFGGTDVEQALTLAAGLGASAYDRSQEAEADAVGLQALKAAGISPTGMADFFERLAQETTTPPELLSSHPDPGKRAETVRARADGFKPTAVLPGPSGVRCN